MIEGFTIRNGFVEEGTGPGSTKGGGVLCLGGHPSLTNCRIIDNTASADGGLAIAVGGAVLTDCLISGNHADFSAGILSADSALSLQNYLVDSNVTDDAGGLGGGIYVYGRDPDDDGARWSRLDLSDTVISNNVNGDSDGWIDASGLLAYRSDITATNCRILANIGHGPSTPGGDISNAAMTLYSAEGHFHGCAIEDNTCNERGGAAIFMAESAGSAFGSNLTLTECFIGDNEPQWMPSATETGSAVRSNGDCVLNLSGTTICGTGPAPVVVSTVNDDGTNCVAAFCGDADGDGTLDLCEADDGDGVLHVPGEYERIQAAAVAASDGDTILVQPGVYTGFGPAVLAFTDKALVLQSATPLGAVLDGEGVRAVIQSDPETPVGSELIGFEIRNGMSSYGGGIEDR